MLKPNRRLLLWGVGPLLLLFLGLVLRRADPIPSPQLEVQVLSQVRTDAGIRITVLVTNSGNLPFISQMTNLRHPTFPEVEYWDGNQWTCGSAVGSTVPDRVVIPFKPNTAGRVEFLVPAGSTQFRFKSYCAVPSTRTRVRTWLYNQPQIPTTALYSLMNALLPFEARDMKFTSPEYKVEAR
jgi:hypothetical protein